MKGVASPYFFPLPSRLSFSDYVCMIKCLGRRSRYFRFTQTNAALNNERWPACIFQIFIEAKLFLPHGSLTLFELTRCLHSHEEKLLPWLNTFSYKNYQYIVTKKRKIFQTICKNRKKLVLFHLCSTGMSEAFKPQKRLLFSTQPLLLFFSQGREGRRRR